MDVEYPTSEHGRPSTPVFTQDDAKKILDSHVQQCGFVYHQKESFDQFICETLSEIIMENSDIVVQTPDKGKSTFSFQNVRTPKPSITESNGYVRDITPTEARLRGLTYTSSVFVDVHQRKQTSNGEEEVHVFSDILVARLPVMVGSSACAMQDLTAVDGNECWYDQGGYFIVNGVEKGFVAQEKLRINHPFIFRLKGDRKSTISCEVRSCHERKLRSTSTLYINATPEGVKGITELMVTVPFVSYTLPLPWIFALLGVTSKADAERMLFSHDSDSPKLHSALTRFVDANDFDITREQAQSMVQGKRVKYEQKHATGETQRKRLVDHEQHMKHVISNEVLPHIGLDDSPETEKAKAWFIAHSIRRIFKVHIGELVYDDRDHYANKRIDTAGGLMSLLFRQLFRSFLKHASAQLCKFVSNQRVNDISAYISHKKISSGFRYAFATGNWGIQKSSSTQMGVVQVLSRMTSVSPISSLQRTNTPLCREGKAPEPRQLHRSSWGIVCAAETPEGGSCGLMRNLCVFTKVRLASDTSLLWERLSSMTLPHGFGLMSWCGGDGIPIFVNGVCRATVYSQDARIFTETAREYRRQMIIPSDVSIHWDSVSPCIQVTCDRGALCRPVIVTKNISRLRSIVDRNSGSLRPRIWNELIINGVIEYLDKEEEDEMRIAVHWEEVVDAPENTYTHCEIHATVINGICAGQIPFSDHNQAPRNCYQSAMGKQAVGLYATNFLQRMDNVAHVLMQPQRPLVTTWTDEMLGSASVPSGANAIVAIMCWGGYNQEDSVILNRTSLENGLFGSVMYKTYREESRPGAGDTQSFECPDEKECINMRTGNYDTLAGHSVAPVGTDVEEGDVIIGKTVTTKVKATQCTQKRDASLAVKGGDRGTVDMTLRTENGSHQVVKVRTRQVRIPEVGDKLASRHGQKGVIGIIYDEKDMPFTSDGLRPDIIVNPHAIPSRMTIGMLVEMLLGKECLFSGRLGDGTPFRGTSVEKISDLLETRGESRDGTEQMFNAYTGERMEARVFIAPCFYQRLKHMVTDKIHARGRGPVQLLTRQPNEGRSRDGGLRFGEMERDCILAHGCAATLKECLCDKSDPYVTVACAKCGVLCEHLHHQVPHPSRHADPGYCRSCVTTEHTRHVRIPYAMKLLIQELQALHVVVRFKFASTPSKDSGEILDVFEPTFEFC